jgi:hypothetical protein
VAVLGKYKLGYSRFQIRPLRIETGQYRPLNMNTLATEQSKNIIAAGPSAQGDISPSPILTDLKRQPIRPSRLAAVTRAML